MNIYFLADLHNADIGGFTLNFGAEPYNADIELESAPEWRLRLFFSPFRLDLLFFFAIKDQIYQFGISFDLLEFLFVSFLRCFGALRCCRITSGK